MKPSSVGTLWNVSGRWEEYSLRIRAVRRAVLIVFLVILGAAIGGGIGVGVAMYFLQRQGNQSSEVQEITTDTTGPSIPEAAEVAKQLAMGESSSNLPSGSRSTREKAKEPAGDTSYASPDVSEVPSEGAVADTTPSVEIASKDTSKGELRLGGENLATRNKKTGGGGIGQVTVPTIDLSSTIDLTTPRTRTTPKVPTVEPDLKKTTPTFTISSLSEEEIKRVYYNEGNLAKAERMLRKELKQNPKSTLAKKYLRLIKLERQALALEAQGDSEGAKRIWQQILRIAPDHPRAKKHLK